MEEFIKFLKKPFAMVILSLFIFFYIYIEAYSSSVRGVTDKTVKIGIIADLTGPAAGGIWIPCVEAMRCYIRNVNENGGIHGRKILTVIEDDRYSIPMALSAFKKVVFRDRVLLLMGASGVGHTYSIIPLAEKNEVAMIAVTNDSRYFNPVRKYIFSPLPFYEDQVKLIFEYIFKDLQAKKPSIAIVYPDVAAGRVCRDACREMTKVYNNKNLIDTIISTGSVDFTSQVLHLKRLKPDYVIMYGYVGSTSGFLRDAYKFKFKTNFIAIQYACVDDTIRIAGVAAKDLMGINCFSSWNDNCSGMVELRKIVLKYHPETTWKNRTYTQGWFASILFHNAFKNAGRELTTDTVIQGLERINNFDTNGICGIVSYGPNDHKPIDYSRLYKADIEKKQFVPITDWRKPPKLK